MARKGRKKRKGSKKARANQVPLDILEKRLSRLSQIVKKRGGVRYISTAG